MRVYKVRGVAMGRGEGRAGEDKAGLEGLEHRLRGFGGADEKREGEGGREGREREGRGRMERGGWGRGEGSVGDLIIVADECRV
jgi:hypothetical protein